MKISTPVIAKELKQELTSFGVKVLMCKQSNKNALIAISSEQKNVDLFLSFCDINNYAGVCGLKFTKRKTDQKHIDYGNIYKYVNV